MPQIIFNSIIIIILRKFIIIFIIFIIYYFKFNFSFKLYTSILINYIVEIKLKLLKLN